MPLTMAQTICRYTLVGRLQVLLLKTPLFGCQAGKRVRVVQWRALEIGEVNLDLAGDEREVNWQLTEDSGKGRLFSGSPQAALEEHRARPVANARCHLWALRP